MKKENLIKSREAKEEIRMLTFKLLEKRSMSDAEIRELMGISESALTKWKRAIKKGGKKALVAKKAKGGRPTDDAKNLTEKEKQKLEKIISKTPRENRSLMLDFGLWTIRIIQEVIKTKFKKVLKYWKVRKILDEMGFSNQTPLFRAYQQNPAKVEERINETLPGIIEESIEENREIMYGDEAGFKSTDNRGKTRGKKGATPTVKSTGARFGVNAISAISKRGVLRFMVYQNSFTSDTLLLFLKRLIYQNNQKISLILDGHPTHKTKKVKDYLISIDHQIKIYYLPGYSPELNPDEQVWLHARGDLKGRFAKSVTEQVDMVRKVLYKQQKQVEKIKSYFRHPDVKFKNT